MHMWGNIMYRHATDARTPNASALVPQAGFTGFVGERLGELRPACLEPEDDMPWNRRNGLTDEANTMARREERRVKNGGQEECKSLRSTHKRGARTRTVCIGGSRAWDNLRIKSESRDGLGLYKRVRHAWLCTSPQKDRQSGRSARRPLPLSTLCRGPLHNVRGVRSCASSEQRISLGEGEFT
jgi:hypothetical protein